MTSRTSRRDCPAQPALELCAASIEELNEFEFNLDGALTVLGAEVQKMPVALAIGTAMATGAFLGVGQPATRCCLGSVDEFIFHGGVSTEA